MYLPLVRRGAVVASSSLKVLRVQEVLRSKLAGAFTETRTDFVTLDDVKDLLINALICPKVDIFTLEYVLKKSMMLCDSKAAVDSLCQSWTDSVRDIQAHLTQKRATNGVLLQSVEDIFDNVHDLLNSNIVLFFRDHRSALNNPETQLYFDFFYKNNESSLIKIYQTTQLMAFCKLLAGEKKIMDYDIYQQVGQVLFEHSKPFSFNCMFASLEPELSEPVHFFSLKLF